MMLGRSLLPCFRQELVMNEHSPDSPLNLLTEGRGQWRVFKVSPLYNLQPNLTKLKQYSNKIKQALSCHIPDTSTVKYRVDFGVDSVLKKHPNDPDALLINIYTTRPESAEVISYSAVLMSWGVYGNVPRATHLPLLLERGKHTIGTTVKLALIKMFDCCISPFYFTKSHMLRFSMIFCELEPVEEDKHINFCFKVPQSNRKHTIKLGTRIRDMLILREGITAVESEELTRPKLVELLYIKLQRHMFLVGHMDISVLDLVEVSHPKANVKTNATVRLKSVEITSAVLDVFNELLPN